MQCVGEHTYPAQWPSEEAVVAFQQTPEYRGALDELAPLLCVPQARAVVLTA